MRLRAAITLAVSVPMSIACGGGSSTPQGAAAPAASAREDERAKPHVAVGLRLEEAPSDPDGAPRTALRVVKLTPEGDREIVDVGVFGGACVQDADVRRGTVVSARCWWAGAGSEIWIERRGDELVVLHRETREGAPAGETRSVTTIALPEGAVVDPIGAD